MGSGVAIKVDHISKDFKLPHEKSSSIKNALINFTKRKRGYELQHVLDDVSFEIKKGEFFGIVGRNGSGKSTLLKLLAGIYTPTAGAVHISGKLTPFIELGVGFNPELTGRENVFLNGALLGFSRKEMELMYDDIVSFAELERFMDQKLKNYSSGMHVRLAFSIAIRAKSDILLIDEVLAVGDAAFQTKCFDYFSELKKKGTTVVFISHDRGSLERFCDRGILIDGGKVIDRGSIKQILKSYSSIVLRELEKAQEQAEGVREPKQAAFSSAARIQRVQVLSKNLPQRKITFGEPISLRFEVKVMQKIVNPVIGFTIWQKNVNKAIYATNTLIEGNKTTGIFGPGEVITFEANLPRQLNDGEYHVEPAITNEATTVVYDQKQNATSFIINGSNNPHSIMADGEVIKLAKG